MAKSQRKIIIEKVKPEDFILKQDSKPEDIDYGLAE
jgi:hypothetical protein